MVSDKKNRVIVHPEGLCKKCGRCCRVVVNTKYSYQEMIQMAENGDDYANDFINLFEPYTSIEEAKKADLGIVNNTIEKLKTNNKFDETKLTFYKCRYILSNNRCSIYEERPEFCVNNPANPWSIMPPGCGYESWQFLKREEAMQKVRKSKEELLELKIMRRNTNDERILQKINSVENKIQNTINMFAEYGSCNW